MREVTRPGSGPSRRLVALGVAGGVVAALAGCGIRLEDDAPRVPLVPTREPIPAEDALILLLTTLRSAALSPVVAAVPVSGSLAQIHETQSTVLHDALRQRGVPEAELATASPSPTGSATPTASGPASTGTTTPTATPSPSPTLSGPAAVAASERTILAAGAACAEAEEDLRPMVLAALAQASAAIELVTGAPTRSAPVTEWAAPDPLAEVVTATRTAIYFLEVAAARSDKKVRAAMRTDLDALTSVVVEVVDAAGTSAPEPGLGQPLPYAVSTPAQAARLARDSVTTLLSEWGRALSSLAAKEPEAAFADVPGWLGTVAAVAHRRGVKLAPFPGLE